MRDRITMLRRTCNFVIPLLLLAGATTTFAAEKPESQPIGGKITWVYDYEDAQGISRDTGKPMFVVFRCER